jgi:hypothetical protein
MSMDRFEVRTDRAALRRYVRRRAWLLGSLGVVQMAAFGLLVGISIGSAGGLAYPVAGGAILGAVGYLFGYAGAATGPVPRLRKRLALDRVLALDPAGLWMPVLMTEAREVRLPWAAVGDVTTRRVFRHTIVTINARPGVDAGFPGAVGLADPAVLRLVTGPGLQLGLRFTDTDAETVLAAIHRLRLAAARRA